MSYKGVLGEYNFRAVARIGFCHRAILGDEGIYTAVISKEDLTRSNRLPLIWTLRQHVKLKLGLLVLNKICFIERIYHESYFDARVVDNITTRHPLHSTNPADHHLYKCP